MIGEQPMCKNCKHYTGGLTCTPYPNGIPADIVHNVADHRKPFKGDGGIRYEAIDPDYELPDQFNS